MPLTHKGLDEYMATVRRKPQPTPEPTAPQPRRVTQFNPAAVGLRPSDGLSRTNVQPTQNRATSPNVAASRTAPLPPTKRPRNEGLFMCHDCGGTWRVEITDVFTNVPPTFCPCCGTQRLRPASDSWGGLSADCFKLDLQVERLLAQLLYEQWRKNEHHEQDRHARFVDYLKEQLSA